MHWKQSASEQVAFCGAVRAKATNQCCHTGPIYFHDNFQE
jgi:hypothetical protein